MSPSPSRLAQFEHDLLAAADPVKAAFFPRFFKAEKGGYAEGDKFLGVTVPKQRLIAKTYYANLSLEETLRLLYDEWHEYRLTALFILVLKFQKGDATVKQQIFNVYLENRHCVNNWDLVDSSAPYIVGAWLFDKDRRVLYELAASEVLWDRRIAMVATLWFIRKGDFADALELAGRLLKDKHDLMHKAVGWCLRETGKRAPELLVDFLDKHAADMPRTALRYAIEHFPPEQQRYYRSLKKV